MGSPIINTLPVMQLVCNLVPLGTSGNVTNSAPDQPPLQRVPLPNGYDLFHYVTAYKYHDIDVTLLEAKDLCAQEGAKVAVIDSIQKLEYLKNKIQLQPGRDRDSVHVHAGIIRLDGEWVNVNTGLPVLSIPWESYQPSREPSGGFDCVKFWTGYDQGTYNGVHNGRCSERIKYVCEFPIRTSFTNHVVFN